MVLVNISTINILPDWRVARVRPRDRLYIGLSGDAWCVLQHTITPDHDMCESNDATKVWHEQKIERFMVRHIERLPRNTLGPAQVQHIREVLAGPGMKRAVFVLNCTEIELPAAKPFDTAGLHPQKIMMTTTGDKATRGGPNIWNVPAGVLASELKARIDPEELKVAPELAEADNVRNAFDLSNDLVLSVAIAVFAALNRNESTRTELRL